MSPTLVAAAAVLLLLIVLAVTRKLAAASVLLIRGYQLTLGPVFGVFSQCRYEPSCSHYGMAAIRRFGVRRGWWMALCRIGRCNPFGGSGYDPVPSEYVSRAERRRRRRAAEAAGHHHGEPA